MVVLDAHLGFVPASILRMLPPGMASAKWPRSAMAACAAWSTRAKTHADTDSASASTCTIEDAAAGRVAASASRGAVARGAVTRGDTRSDAPGSSEIADKQKTVNIFLRRFLRLV